MSREKLRRHRRARPTAPTALALAPSEVPLNQCQLFLWGTDRAYDVEHAHRILAAAPRETEQLNVAVWAHVYGLDGNSETNISVADTFDRGYAMTVDLSRPLIVATVRGTTGAMTPLVIDGIHRLFRGHVEGVLELPAYRLSAAESHAVTRTIHIVEL